MSMTKAEFEAKDAEGKKSSFISWMSQPMTRMVMAQLPPNESLEILLRAAFEAGWNSGGAHTGVQFLAAVMDDSPRERR